MPTASALELAYFLEPRASSEEKSSLSVKQLELRYKRLPSMSRNLLLDIAAQLEGHWNPGPALLEWEAQLQSESHSESDSLFASAPKLPKPSQVADFGEDPESFTKNLLEENGETLERRGEQIFMAKDVARALQEQTFGIIEAGTGTGKTLGYLAPAAIWAMSMGERVVVSTNTKVLQEQILEKETPLLRSLLNRYVPTSGDQLSLAVVKGRGNYLCLGALERACRQVTNVSEATFLARLTVWASSTLSGDRAELSLSEDDEREFSFLSAAEGRCSMRRCRHFINEECFLARAKARAKASHVVVVNHALLVAERDQRFLIPDAWGLVVDEAHELENAATNVMTAEMPRSWLSVPLSRIFRQGRRRSFGIAVVRPTIGKSMKSELMTLTMQAQEALDILYEQMGNWSVLKSRLKVNQFATVILSDAVRRHPGWRSVVDQWLFLRATIETICDLLDQLDFEYLAAAVDDLAEARSVVELTAEVTQTRTRLHDRAARLDQAFRENSDKLVTWLERPSGTVPTLISAPLKVGNELRPLWHSFESVVLTGATLATEDGFDFLSEGIGFGAVWESRYGSPFDYAERTRLVLLSGMPDSTAPNHSKAVADAIVQLSRATNGRSMALFTSNVAMWEIAELVRPALESSGLQLKVQGEDGLPAEVAQCLRDDSRVIVFGVASMWSGVDIPGDNLSQLIITKLPFPWFKHPVQEARAKSYSDGFSDYTLPQAILQFRQGFGRLMRKQSDRGVVVVLDGRIGSKPYGREFVTSVMPVGVHPAKWIRRASVADAASEIEAFLDSIPVGS